MLQSSGLCAALLPLCSLGSKCQRSIWVAAAVAAEALQPVAGGISSSVPALSQDAASSNQPMQAPQHDVQQQQQMQQPQRSLHELFLYQMPDPQQPLPRLPRFRPPTPVQQPLPVLEALQWVKANSRAHFPETVEAHIRLKVDPRRGDQMVRGAAVLPHSLGKPLRIAVFAEGAAAQAAQDAGADVVGSDALVAGILESKGKDINFNACIATPDMMPKLVKLGRILGPKGLMPNPKMGTLTEDVTSAIAELRRGRVEFKMDRTGIVHAPIGRVPFGTQALYANIGALTAALLAVKPEAIKGGLPKYVRSVHVCSTMGQAVPVEVSTLLAAMDAAAAVMQKQQQAVSNAQG